METQKALIGMSGGVDSSVAAWLMLRQGYACQGGTMRLHSFGCGGSDDARDAAAVASRLGIPHRILDCREAFARQVIGRFVGSYQDGQTPNPCVECNRHLKFGVMLHWALEQGFDCVVSGHYARICRDEATGRYLLRRALDPEKDQTYFLACLDQHQLAHIRFPLGDLTKAQVRQLAEEQGFVTARKRDSQDICFIPGGDYGAFLEEYTGRPSPAGDYLDLSGRVVGRHRGAVNYTLGQRKGLNLALGTPVYVCAKDMTANTVTVGPNEALFSPALLAKDWNWFPFESLTGPLRVSAKIRHSRTEHPATVYPLENGTARVEFDQSVRAVTPGQAVVLYDGDLVIGGGTITAAL